MSYARPASLARMWGAVSAAHSALERRRVYFLTQPVEERLAEQLSLIPVLHDWMPITLVEVEPLSTILRLYATADDLDRDRVAKDLVDLVRSMAARRARAGLEGESA
ncbi:MAG: hypothetical protein JWP74_939 [Marmoricola sp.]|nr:hypothetical protein [Marmoricola sp.]